MRSVMLWDIVSISFSARNRTITCCYFSPWFECIATEGFSLYAYSSFSNFKFIADLVLVAFFHLFGIMFATASNCLSKKKTHGRRAAQLRRKRNTQMKDLHTNTRGASFSVPLLTLALETLFHLYSEIAKQAYIVRFTSTLMFLFLFWFHFIYLFCYVQRKGCSFNYLVLKCASKNTMSIHLFQTKKCFELFQWATVYMPANYFHFFITTEF